MALTTWTSYQAVNTPQAQRLTQVLLCAKGIGQVEPYVLEVDPLTGAIPVGGSLSIGSIAYMYNGVLTNVTYDSGTPVNNRPLPVTIAGSSGPVNITAGDLNVEILHNGPAPSSVQIGDGTTIMGVTLANEAKVHTTGTGASPSSMQITDGTHTLAISAAGGLATVPGGRAQANVPVRNAYGTTPVTTAAFVQVVASTTAVTNHLDIFDSSGQTIAFATGGAGSEVVLFYIFPGGISCDCAIPAGTRISLKAVSANASVGEFDCNFWS